jgi:hypothetical protein
MYYRTGHSERNNIPRMVAYSIHSSYILTNYMDGAGRVSAGEEIGRFNGNQGTNVGLL